MPIRRANMIMKAAEYHPDSPEEQIDGLSVLLPLPLRNGFVFLIAKTQKNLPDTEPLLELLLDQIHRLPESFGSEANAQHRFEQFLGALNETLAQQVREGHVHLPIQQLNAVVGIACDQKMFFSGTGDLTALFLHRKPSQRYQLFNLFRSIQTEQSLPTWEKAFAVVLDGDLHEGDVFMISNQDLQRTIPADELNLILTSIPPKGSVEKIRQYFSLKTSLLLIVIKLSDENESSILSESRATLKTDVSVRKFQEQEAATQKILADQAPKLSSLFSTIKHVLKSVNEKRIPEFLWREGKRQLWHLLKFLMKLKTKNIQRDTKKQVTSRAQKLNGNVRNLFKRLVQTRRSSKYLVLGIIIVAFALIMSISIFSKTRARSQQQREYLSQIETIEDLIERGAGAVIYKDENQARGLFVNASTLIDQLPTETDLKAQKKQELNENIQKAMDDIRHLVSVPNPALLGDLNTLQTGMIAQAFVKNSQGFLVFASDGRVYELDRTQKVFKPITTQEATAQVTIAATTEDDRVYSLLGDQSILQLNQAEATQKAFVLTKPDGTIVDVIAYADRLYLLSVTQDDGQVYRLTMNGESLGAPTKWITAKTSILKDARSIMIDGTVYLLEKNGLIRRFVSGSQVEWELGVVDPPITNATDLWTDTDSKYLYVLEPDTKRVIVFHKDSGAFVVQYRSEAFQNLSDFVVDEAAYAIYLLSGSKIYSIAPSHMRE